MYKAEKTSAGEWWLQSSTTCNLNRPKLRYVSPSACRCHIDKFLREQCSSTTKLGEKTLTLLLVFRRPFSRFKSPPETAKADRIRIVVTITVALLVARRTNNRKVVGSRPTKVVCIIVLTCNRLGWTVRCGRPPLLPSCRKLEFTLSVLIDSDLAWVW